MKKICVCLVVSLCLSLMASGSGSEAKEKNPLKGYVLNKTVVEVKRGKTSTIRLALKKGKKKKALAVKKKRDVVKTSFSLRNEEKANGSIKVSKKGVVTVSCRSNAEPEEPIGEVVVKVTEKKKTGRKWKKYSKKYLCSIYVAGEPVKATPKVRVTPEATSVSNPHSKEEEERKERDFIYDFPTSVPTATPTNSPTPRPRATPTPKVTTERIGEIWSEESPEWKQQVAGTYSRNHLIYTWEELEEMGAITMEGDRLIRINKEAGKGRTYKYEWKTTTTHFDGREEVVYGSEEKYSGGCGQIILPKDIKIIGDGKNLVLGDKGARTDIIIPEGVEEIAPHAFEWHQIPSEVLVLPESCTKIGEEAFFHCTCPVIKLSDNVTYIGDRAFSNSQLWLVNIPKKLKYLGEDAFSSCTAFRAKKDENNQELEIDKKLYEKAGVMDFVLQENTGEVVLPECLEYLGGGAFAGGKFKSIRLPSHITEIPPELVCDATNLTDVTIPAGVTKIWHIAFAGCKSLSLEVPDTVTEIGKRAFEDVPNVWYRGTAEDKDGNKWGAKRFNDELLHEEDIY